MVPLGVLGTGAFVLMTTLVGRVGGSPRYLAIYFVPVVAILLGAVLLGEPIAPIGLAGTALVLLGPGLASCAENQVPRHSPGRREVAEDDLVGPSSPPHASTGMHGFRLKKLTSQGRDSVRLTTASHVMPSARLV